MQQEMCAYRFLSLKCKKAQIFRGSKALRKVKRYQESYKRQFQRQQNTNQDKADVFRGKIERS